MIGSYGPRPELYEKTFASSEAPSGMMARGNYSVRSRVVDDDNNVFADWEWAFKVSSLVPQVSASAQPRPLLLTLSRQTLMLLNRFSNPQIAKDW